MSSIKEYVDNFTDEQILSSAYMCCQRNAVKAARNNLNEANNRRCDFNTHQSKEDFKQMHRETHFSISIKGFIKFYILLFIFSWIAMYIIEYNKPGLGRTLLKIYPFLMIGILLFPIIRRIIIEIDIAKKYKSVKSMYSKSFEIDAPIEANLSLQLKDMDEYLSKNCVIPRKYWDYALNLVEYIYVDYRATNLREAINILEEDLHRRRLENRMAKIEQLSIENANAINDMFERIDNIECFQNYLRNRQSDVEWDLFVQKIKN